MKISYASAILVVILFFSVGYHACIKDKCTTNICNNGGTCVDGICACKDGYEGTDCSIRWSDKFSGNWQVNELFNNDTVRRFYSIEVSGSSRPDSFVIYGLADSLNVLCTKASNKKFTFVADQKIDTFLTIKSGNGSINTETQTVTGLYSFQRKMIINDSTAKDTLITTKFTWTR